MSVYLFCYVNNGCKICSCNFWTKMNNIPNNGLATNNADWIVLVCFKKYTCHGKVPSVVKGC